MCRQKFDKTMKIIPLDERTPDVEVEFIFNGTKKNPVVSGYRPDHLIKDNYLTCGVHNYHKDGLVMPDESVLGTITFITPEVYPHCLWIGKEINIQEGARIVGTAKIISIHNPILDIEVE